MKIPLLPTLFSATLMVLVGLQGLSQIKAQDSTAGSGGRRRAVVQPGLATPTPFPTPEGEFKTQVFAGYQGWFSTFGDGDYDQWVHWSPGTPPRPKQINFELYPDVRDYAPTDLAYTDLGKLGNGDASRLFSSHRPGVIDLHFKWMQEYGIDGAALQRFVVATVNDWDLTPLDNVAALVKTSAEKYGRIFYVEYDVSGFAGNNQGEIIAHIQRDFTENVENKLHLPDSPVYARQGGKPVVEIWGLGFDHTKVITQTMARELIQWFRQKGYYVVGGVPYQWRSNSSWIETFKLYNMIQPWAVGNRPNVGLVAQDFQGIIKDDKKFCGSHGMDYGVVIYPGFAWSNWNGGPPNAIPRQAGSFFWTQAYYAAILKPSVFIAMFDEYDEGTAIAKAAEDASMIPVDQYFLTLDADHLKDPKGQVIKPSSDFYLRLAGAATTMLHGKRNPSLTLPVPYR